MRKQSPAILSQQLLYDLAKGVTTYEFFTALSAFRANGTPNILVFRNFIEPRRPSRPKEAREAADRELDRLDHFFERYFQDGNFFTAAVNEYRTPGEFEDKLSLRAQGQARRVKIKARGKASKTCRRPQSCRFRGLF